MTILVFVGLGILFTFFLGIRPLATPDEGRYVEIPREMLASGDCITPHLNGLPYFEKPPLLYWIEAAFLKVFGPHTFALRLPIALFALLGCGLVYVWRQKEGCAREGLYSALILGTSVLYFVLGRIIILDLVFTVWMTAGLLCFWRAQQDGAPRKRWLGGYGLCLGAALMTKGLIGIVVPGSILLIWIIWRRDWRQLRLAFHPLSLLVFLIVAVPWHLAVALRNPDFLWFYLVHEHVIRYTTTVHERAQPWWFFAPVVLLGFFPWTAVLGRALRWNFVQRRRNSQVAQGQSVEEGETLLWGIWAVFVVVFFSLSGSKLIPYALPALPPLALLVGRYVGRVGLTRPDALAFSAAFALFSVAILATRTLGWVEGTEGMDTSHLPTLLMGACVWTGLTAGVLLWGSRTPYIFPLTIAGMVGFLGWATWIDPLVQRTISIEPVAQLLKQIVPPQGRIVACGFYPQDLPVFLNQTIQVAHWGGELNFGASIRPGQDRLLGTEAFDALWRGQAPVFVIALQRTQRVDWDTFLKERLPNIRTVAMIPPYVIYTQRLRSAP